jgi:hypothetical protein
MYTGTQIGIAQSVKSDVDFGAESRRGRLKVEVHDFMSHSVKSVQRVSFNLVFARPEKVYQQSSRICLLFITREGKIYHQALSSVSVVMPDIADKIILLSRP